MLKRNLLLLGNTAVIVSEWLSLYTHTQPGPRKSFMLGGEAEEADP